MDRSNNWTMKVTNTFTSIQHIILVLRYNRSEIYILDNTEARSRNHCCHRLTVSITNSECVSVASVIQYAVCMRRIILSICLSVCTTFFHIIWKRARFSKKKKFIGHKICFLFSLKLSSEAFPILRRTERDTIPSAHRSLCKVALFLSDFNEKSFLDRFSKYTLVSNLMKIHPFWRTDGRRDRRDESKSHFSQFLRTRPKIQLVWSWQSTETSALNCVRCWRGAVNESSALKKSTWTCVYLDSSKVRRVNTQPLTARELTDSADGHGVTPQVTLILCFSVSFITWCGI